MAFPSTIDAPDTTMQGGSLLTTNDHANDHRLLGSAVINLETKLGIGSGSAAVNQILVGQGAGTATWGTVWNQANLGSATLTGGTINNPVMGTPSITGGTITNTVMSGTPSFTNGTANNLTLGTPVLSGAWNGWVNPSETWTILGTAAIQGTIIVGGTASNKYDKGDKINFTQGGTNMYMSVIASGGTTITVTGGNDFVLGTGAITANQYSKVVSPNGHPIYYSYTPTYTAEPNLTWTGITTNVSKFRIEGNSLTWILNATGTSGGTPNVDLRVTYPITPNPNTNSVFAGGCQVTDIANIAGNYTLDAVDKLFEFFRYDRGNYNTGQPAGVAAVITYVI